MNPIKALKTQKQAKGIMNELNKLKNHAPTDYMWYALASLSGLVNSAGEVLNIKSTIAKAKEFYPEIAAAPKERSSARMFELDYTDDDKQDIKVNVYEKQGRYYYEGLDKSFTLFPVKDIEKCGLLLNPETEKELLNDKLLLFKDTVKHSSEKVLGGFYTKQIFKGTE